MKIKALLIGIGLSLMIAPALAVKPGDRGDTPGLGWGKGGKSVSTPGPLIGLGPLGLLGLAGCYWVIRRGGGSQVTRKRK